MPKKINQDTQEAEFSYQTLDDRIESNISELMAMRLFILRRLKVTQDKPEREALEEQLESLQIKLDLNLKACNLQQVNSPKEPNSIVYAELLLNPTSELTSEPTKESTVYAEILGHSEEEIVKSQIAILRDEKKEYIKKLNQAIDEGKKDFIDDYCSQLSAIEISMVTKIDYLEKHKTLPLGGDEVTSPRTTQELDWEIVTADEILEIPTLRCGDKLGEEAKKRVEFTQSTIKREDLKEKQKEASESKQNYEQAPAVDRSTKPGPEVNRRLKPLKKELTLINRTKKPPVAESNSFFQQNKNVQATNVSAERHKSPSPTPRGAIK